MSEPQNTTASPDKKQRLLAIFERLLPLIDNMADKLRFVLIIGLLLIAWIGTWVFAIKHFSLTITLLVVVLALLPLLVLLRFWWALEELKNLPEIAGQMLGDAKNELRASIQGSRANSASKLSFLSAGKGLWSVGSMLAEVRELLGSYIGMSTLINPVMLILGAISLGFVLFLIVVSIVLVFLAV